MKKLSLILLISTLLLTSCATNKNLPITKNMIIGTCTIKFDDFNMATTIYNKDGTFTGVFLNTNNNQKNKYHVTGVWSLKNNILSDVIITSDASFIKAGKKTSDLVLDVNHKYIELKSLKYKDSIYKCYKH